MMDNVKIMFSLIRFSLYGDEAVLSGIELSDELIESIIKTSTQHDLAHLIALAIKKSSLSINENYSKRFDSEINKAIARSIKTEYELSKISKILENSGTDYIPLKGSVIREIYPESWMRTSCDIDILIHEEDIEKSKQTLLSAGYKLMSENYHDISFMSANGVHLELHFNIRENIDSMDCVLDTVWDNVVAVEAGKHQYRMTNEFLLFHTVAHMAYHFHSGGCGIRPFLDLDLMEKNITVDSAASHAHIARAGLSEFYSAVNRLLRVWFADEKHDDLTAQMESYIINGGVFGNIRNSTAVGQDETGGKVGLLLKRVFPPLSQMRFIFPVLDKAPVLLPACWLIRALKQPFSKKMKQHIAEAKIISEANNDEVRELSRMMHSLGLSQSGKGKE